ncbi:MAG: exodeoxyribonuclease V subunit alpha, partial [Ilumatobacteraceae bacterium]
PGTGKTYSVARVLMALLTDAHERGEPLSVALAAPTGKAAARLEESIRAAVESVEQADRNPDSPVAETDRLLPAVREQLLNLGPTTVHRLLGSRYPVRTRFRHDASTPLRHDIVIVDETSMVSMPLLARLLEAVRPDARLVLIGDPDQLESVELGSVLGDIVASAGRSTSPVNGHMVRLVRGRRFGADSPIAHLADAVRTGDADAAVGCLHRDGLAYIAAERPDAPVVVGAVGKVIEPVLTALREAAERGDAATALQRLVEARILCAHREGRFGVEFWNRTSEKWLCGTERAVRTWYPGRPVLVTKNDVRLNLANGDTGVVVSVDGELKVAFTKTGKGGAAEGVRLVNPVDLADVETAYAMTIHKSQGSEYGAVVLVLPPATSPLVGRELVYTAVTRAKHHLMVIGSEEAVRVCVATPARRMTGLAESLATA